MKALRQRKGRIITKAGSHKSEKKKTVKGEKNSKRGGKKPINLKAGSFCGKTNHEKEKRTKIQIKELIRANTQIWKKIKRIIGTHDIQVYVSISENLGNYISQELWIIKREF